MRRRILLVWGFVFFGVFILAKAVWTLDITAIWEVHKPLSFLQPWFFTCLAFSILSFSETLHVRFLSHSLELTPEILVLRLRESPKRSHRPKTILNHIKYVDNRNIRVIRIVNSLRLMYNKPRMSFHKRKTKTIKLSATGRTGQPSFSFKYLHKFEGGRQGILTWSKLGHAEQYTPVARAVAWAGCSMHPSHCSVTVSVCNFGETYLVLV